MATSSSEALAATFAQLLSILDVNSFSAFHCASIVDCSALLCPGMQELVVKAQIRRVLLCEPWSYYCNSGLQFIKYEEWLY